MTLDEAIKHAEEVAERNEWFDKNCLESMQCRKCAEEHRQLAEWLKELKQLRKQTGWIPVNEELPQEYRFVNCTCHSLIDDREDWVIETIYIPQPPDSPYSEWGNIPMLNWKQAEVVAWMYRDIPEPYKVESEE